MEKSDKELLEWLRDEVLKRQVIKKPAFMCNIIADGDISTLESCRLWNKIEDNYNMAVKDFKAINPFIWWLGSDYNSRIAFLNELIKREEEK